MPRLATAVALAVSLSGCAAFGPLFDTLFQRAVSSPGGISAGRSSNPNVHCQTGPDGRTDCAEYRTSAPLRNGDPAPVGGDPYASTGPSANASAGPATMPLLVPAPGPKPAATATPAPSSPAPAPPAVWQAPLAPAPQPLPALPPP